MAVRSECITGQQDIFADRALLCLSESDAAGRGRGSWGASTPATKLPAAAPAFPQVRLPAASSAADQTAQIGKHSVANGESTMRELAAYVAAHAKAGQGGATAATPAAYVAGRDGTHPQPPSSGVPAAGQAPNPASPTRKRLREEGEVGAREEPDKRSREAAGSNGGGSAVEDLGQAGGAPLAGQATAQGWQVTTGERQLQHSSSSSSMDGSSRGRARGRGRGRPGRPPKEEGSPRPAAAGPAASAPTPITPEQPAAGAEAATQPTAVGPNASNSEPAAARSQPGGTFQPLRGALEGFLSHAWRTK